MTKLLHYLGFVFLLGLIVSCEPSSDADGDLLHGVKNTPITTNPGTSITNKLLKTITFDDEGDITVFSYNYDQNKKLASVTTDDNSITINVSYLPSGNIAKIVRVSKVVGDEGSQEITPVYGNSIITQLKTTHTQGGKSINSVANLSYAANGWPSAINEDVYNETNTAKVASIVSNFKYSGVNMSDWNFKSKIDFSLPVPIFDFLKETDITFSLSNYDTKINPYSLLSKDYLIMMAHANSDTNGAVGFAKNNALKVKAKVVFMGNTVEESQDQQYTYDKDNYLISSVSGDLKAKFEYQ